MVLEWYEHLGMQKGKPVANPQKSYRKSANTIYFLGNYKMVLVVRTDLGMQKGKAAAQCAHAALGEQNC